jgi:GNAT superfamily N-acetyltransferase
MPAEIIELANENDAEEILTLQKLAFQSEAALYNDYTIPPLTQTLEDLRREIGTLCFLKLLRDGRIAGSVHAEQKAGTCFINRLMVHPGVQGHGLGKVLMHAIENRFPQAQRFQLATGDLSVRNLNLYHALGYREFKAQMLTDKVRMVFLEKNTPDYLSPE